MLLMHCHVTVPESLKCPLCISRLAPYSPTISSLHRTRALAWSCPVAFSDNAATAAAIRELTRRKGAHVACRNELRERSAKHKKACQVATESDLYSCAAGLCNPFSITEVLGEGNVLKHKAAQPILQWCSASHPRPRMIYQHFCCRRDESEGIAFLNYSMSAHRVACDHRPMVTSFMG